jgi:hypothetical protein
MTKGLPTSTFESFRSSLCVAAPTHQTTGWGGLKCCIIPGIVPGS